MFSRFDRAVRPDIFIETGRAIGLKACRADIFAWSLNRFEKVTVVVGHIEPIQ